MSLRPKIKTEICQKRYKVAVDEGWRRREDDMVEIRKSKIEENMQKRSREMLQNTNQQQQFSEPSTADRKTLESISAMVLGIWTNNNTLQLVMTSHFRKLLAIERDRPIEEVIQAGVVPRFVEFLVREDSPQLQFEAAWALTNIASGTSDHTKVVIDHGAVPNFVKLLGSPIDDVREQAVWALGNIAGDSSKSRDIVLKHGALPPLLALLNEHATLSMLKNASWTLSNLCRGKPQPPFDQVKPALAALGHLIHSTDEEVLSNVCWGLSCLSDGSNDQIQAVIEAGVCGRLVELLLYQSKSVLIPALRTVGNIVTGDDIQTQCIISHQALPCFLNLLTNNYKKNIKKDACWAISNITAGTTSQLQAIMEAGLISPLLHLLQNAEFNIKKEVAWAVSNALCGGTNEQIKFLVSEGCIEPLCDLLTCSDSGICMACLEGMENILEIGKAERDSGDNLYLQMIKDAGGIDKIENLLSHGNLGIYEKAVQILDTYWSDGNDNDSASGDASQPGVLVTKYQFRSKDLISPKGK